jgi:hypothetical protein
MSVPVPVAFQSIKRRAPEPLEEAVEKCVVDVFAFALRGYCDMSAVQVTRADTGDDLIVPAVVVRSARLRESIPTGDVYEMQIAISIMSLMDRDDDVANCPPQEFMDQLWSATVAIIEDPHLLDVLQTSRGTVTWHGLTRQGSMQFSRQDRHAVRTYRFNVHVSRLA